MDKEKMKNFDASCFFVPEDSPLDGISFEDISAKYRVKVKTPRDYDRSVLSRGESICVEGNRKALKRFVKAVYGEK